MQPMENKQWTTVDKTGWGMGPWQDEPDKVQWRDESTGYPCLIVRAPSGALCGYVGVGYEHPAFGKHYDGVDVSVHGGLTYSGECQEHEDEGAGICHVHPGAGRVWWLGFDCAHYGDMTPQYDSQLLGALRHEGSTYKDQHYVAREVAELAEQLNAMEVEGLRKAWVTFRNIVTYPYTYVKNTNWVQRQRRTIIFWNLRRTMPKVKAALDAFMAKRKEGV